MPVGSGVFALFCILPFGVCFVVFVGFDVVPGIVGEDVVAFFEKALSECERVSSFGVALWVVRAPAGHGGGFDQLGDCYIVPIGREGWHFAEKRGAPV